jgi:hypothetical protein
MRVVGDKFPVVTTTPAGSQLVVLAAVSADVLGLAVCAVPLLVMEPSSIDADVFAAYSRIDTTPLLVTVIIWVLLVGVTSMMLVWRLLRSGRRSLRSVFAAELAALSLLAYGATVLTSVIPWLGVNSVLDAVVPSDLRPPVGTPYGWVLLSGAAAIVIGWSVRIIVRRHGPSDSIEVTPG